MECTASTAQSDGLTFDFKVTSTTTKLDSRELLASTLSGETRFQIVVLKQQGQRDPYSTYGYTVCTIKVGMRRTDAKFCDVKGLLLFEIQNDRGELYVKELVENKFYLLNEEKFSDSFDLPRTRSEVKGRYKNLMFDPDNFIIKGKVFFQSYQEKVVSKPPCKNTSQLQSDLKDLLQNNLYADVTFHISDDVVQAHKNILCARSEVFRKMFEQNMKEKEVNSVKITDIEKSVFEVFLIFLYTGAIQDNKLDTVMPLYSVADEYAVETLLKTCSDILVGYISDTTVVEILKLADMHNDCTLKTTAVNFICKNFVAVEKTDSWDTLLNSDPRLASYALKQVSITAAKNMGVQFSKTS